MKHPNQGTLALHAGGDLGAFARWRMERHLARCEACREEVAKRMDCSKATVRSHIANARTKFRRYIERRKR